MSDNILGKKVQFHAQRVMKGNPVRGVVTEIDDTWIEVQLLKNIEGMTNHWKKGERKSFRRELILGGIKIIQ